MSKPKLVVIHPAIAPYRIDFFNSINRHFDASFYFEFEDALEQSFNQEHTKQRITFFPKYLKPGYKGVKNLRLDVFQILKKEKPEIVFCSEYNMLGFILLISKFLLNRKMKIYTICDDNLEISKQCRGTRKLMRTIFLYLYTGIILADNNALDWYKAKLRHRAKLIYFPIIQNNTLFRQRLEQSLHLSMENKKIYKLENKTVLLYVGRLLEIKNIFLLIDSFKDIREKHKNTMLVIVGDGPQKDDLRQYSIAQYLSKDIIFTGKQEGEELLSWYNIGDIFILPSTFDRFGAVVNEALMAGCHTFCSSVAGASALIKEPYNGQVFNPKNRDELTAKIQDYLEKTVIKHDMSTIKPDLTVIQYEEQFRLFLSLIDTA